MVPWPRLSGGRHQAQLLLCLLLCLLPREAALPQAAIVPNGFCHLLLPPMAPLMLTTHLLLARPIGPLEICPWAPPCKGLWGIVGSQLALVFHTTHLLLARPIGPLEICPWALGPLWVFAGSQQALVFHPRR